jgi:uncharacterized protein YjbI with pentapeptide repeats
MAPRFQRPFAVDEEEERPKAASGSKQDPAKSQDALIPASHLPPAADALAQLFGEAPSTETATSEPDQAPAVATATEPAPENPPPVGAPPRKPGFFARLFASKRAAQAAAEAAQTAQLKLADPARENAATTPPEVTATPHAIALDVPAAETAAAEEPARFVGDSAVLAEIPKIGSSVAQNGPDPSVPIETPIPAQTLPPAAEALEELFPPDETSVPSPVGDAIVELAEFEHPHELAAAEFAESGIDEALGESPADLVDDASAEPMPAEPVTTEERCETEGPAASPGRHKETDRIDLPDEQPALQERPEISDSSETPEAHLNHPPADRPGENEAAPLPSLLSPPQRLYKDWALDEKLASHGEWVESHGRTGQRADLSGAELEASDLISVNLRLADLHDANLRASDLLLADLRDACLVRADLEEACLVGANLEGANLEGASLETAMGLVPRQFAGANLRDALLAPHLMEFDAVTAFEREAKNSFRYFWMMTAASVLSWLAIAKTRDPQLLTDSAIIPFLHSHAAAAALPTAELYLIIPVALFVIYVLFHFHLQRLWDSVVELPAIFPDGHMLGDSGPGILSGLLRTHFRWMNPDPSSTRLVEKCASLAAAYWIVPATLLLFWARYLTRQEIHGTILQVLLATASAGMATYATLKVGRPQEKWAFENTWKQRTIGKMKATNPIPVAATLGSILLLLSTGVIFGVPHDRSRAPQFGVTNIRRWAPTAFWWAAYDPYPDLTEASISRRPPGWNGSEEQVASADGLHANNAKFRYAQAYGAFFANSHLWRADFQGAFLSEADLRGADLGESNMRYALMDHAQMNRANLDRSNLDGADMRRADLREANLSYCSLENTILVDARLDGASFYNARLPGADLTRAILEKADLRETQLVGAHMDHADLRNAYLWSARLPDADLGGAQLEGAILIDADLHGANLGGAQLSGTVLNNASLAATSLEGADLRGALGLTANQVCSAKSRQGVQLDPEMETQVEALCGATH